MSDDLRRKYHSSLSNIDQDRYDSIFKKKVDFKIGDTIECLEVDHAAFRTCLEVIETGHGFVTAKDIKSQEKFSFSKSEVKIIDVPMEK